MVVFISLLFLLSHYNADSSESNSPQVNNPVENSSTSTPPATITTPTPQASNTPTSTSTPTPQASNTPPATITTATPQASNTVDSGNNLDTCVFRNERDRVRAAVVEVFSKRHSGLGRGTAFHIGGGQYITAAHVIRDDNNRLHTNIEIVVPTTGGIHKATVQKFSMMSSNQQGLGRDLAILSSVAIDNKLNLRTPTADDIDIEVRVLGFPWSQEKKSQSEIVPSEIRRTSISNVATSSEGIAVISIGAGTNGMSGGPVVDECGNALGVVSGGQINPKTGDPDDTTVATSVGEMNNID